MAELNEMGKSKLASFKAIIAALSQSKNAFLANEFERLLASEKVRPHAREVMPYIYAGAMLSLTGREINVESISKLLSAIGMDVDKGLVKTLYAAKLRSHVPYINAYYFLLAVGKLGTEEEIMRVIEALGMKPDTSRVEDVISFLYAPPNPK